MLTPECPTLAPPQAELTESETRSREAVLAHLEAQWPHAQFSIVGCWVVTDGVLLRRVA